MPWSSGRKAFQSVTRANLPRFEVEATEDGRGRLKINPLGDWTKDDLEAYFAEHDLPRHPLEAQGFLSVGCQPCTSPVGPGEDSRAGRWRGWDKTECGIHVPGADEGGDELPTISMPPAPSRCRLPARTFQHSVGLSVEGVRRTADDRAWQDVAMVGDRSDNRRSAGTLTAVAREVQAAAPRQFREGSATVYLRFPQQGARVSNGARQRWFSSIIQAGLEQQMFVPSQVLSHVTPEVMAPLCDPDEEVYRALVTGCRDYVRKNGFSRSSLNAFVDTIVARLASFDRTSLASAKAQINRASLPPDADLVAAYGEFSALLTALYT